MPGLLAAVLEATLALPTALARSRHRRRFWLVVIVCCHCCVRLFVIIICLSVCLMYINMYLFVIICLLREFYMLRCSHRHDTVGQPANDTVSHRWEPTILDKMPSRAVRSPLPCEEWPAVGGKYVRLWDSPSFVHVHLRRYGARLESAAWNVCQFVTVKNESEAKVHKLCRGCLESCGKFPR